MRDDGRMETDDPRSRSITRRFGALGLVPAALSAFSLACFAVTPFMDSAFEYTLALGATVVPFAIGASIACFLGTLLAGPRLRARGRDVRAILMLDGALSALWMLLIGATFIIFQE